MVLGFETTEGQCRVDYSIRTTLPFDLEVMGMTKWRMLVGQTWTTETPILEPGEYNVSIDGGLRVLGGTQSPEDTP